MSERKTSGKLIEILRSFISEARAECEHPNSQPAVQHTMLTRPFLRRILRTRGLKMHLIATGLGQEIRRFLKTDPDDGGTVTRNQLELWPARLQSLVQDIGMSRVFVPSRNEFVLLAPKSIGAEEVREAGRYLITKGEDCIRRGETLISLSDRMH